MPDTVSRLASPSRTASGFWLLSMFSQGSASLYCSSVYSASSMNLSYLFGRVARSGRTRIERNPGLGRVGRLSCVEGWLPRRAFRGDCSRILWSRRSFDLAILDQSDAVQKPSPRLVEAELGYRSACSVVGLLLLRCAVGSNL